MAFRIIPSDEGYRVKKGWATETLTREAIEKSYR